LDQSSITRVSDPHPSQTDQNLGFEIFKDLDPGLDFFSPKTGVFNVRKVIIKELWIQIRI